MNKRLMEHQPKTASLFLFCLLLSITAFSQAGNYAFHSLPSEISLNNGTINDVIQDHRGFLWIATWTGLIKYDGYNVKVYSQQPDNANGLKSNKISCLFEDKKGQLWVGTNYTGFYRYDRKQDRFIQYNKNNADPNSLSNDNVETILEDKDGMEGAEKALAYPPDLVIADVAMPRLDGIEMCRKLKTNITTSHIPVVLLTARTSLVFKLDGFESGSDNYKTKPFNFRLLESRIRNLLETRRNLREKFAKSFDISPSDVVVNSMDEQFIAQIKLIVERHMDDSSFSVDNLASGLCMSRMQLYRKLKSLINKSPNEVIRTIRLKRAAQLLETEEYNVSEVTYMVGYNDLKSFREQFKKEFGVSPSDYAGGNGRFATSS